jgi:NAD+ kinase
VAKDTYPDVELPMDHPQPRSFRQVAVLYHPKIEATRPVAADIQRWLAGRGTQVWLESTWEEERVRSRLGGCDLVIVLGGDGSMLRTARVAAPLGMPILGVNMGRLGFLAEMTPDNWEERLPRVLAGSYWLEHRMMLRAQAWRDAHLLCEFLALNDVVISRGTLARMVRLRTEVDGARLTTYVADGLIVSTPTGSTAYALAVGGPILPPDLRNILVIPIAPHLTLDRAIVLAQGAVVGVNVGTDHEAILTVDGQFAFEIRDGDRVCVQASEHVSHFIRLGDHTYFYHMLLDRLEPKHLGNLDPME